MSTVVAARAPASAGPTVSTILARRGVLIAVAIGGLLVAIGAGLLLATSDHLVDPVAFGLVIAVMIVGWFSAALYWLVRRPGNRLALFLIAVAACTVLMSLQGARMQPQLHSIGVLADGLLVLLWFSAVFAFPEARIESRVAWVLLGAIGVLMHGVVRPFAPFLAGRPGQFSAGRAERRVSRERVHDRRSADDRRWSSQQQYHDPLPVRGPFRSLPLPDLPVSDGDAAAEAGTPACLRPGSVLLSLSSRSFTQPVSSSYIWMRARSRT